MKRFFKSVPWKVLLPALAAVISSEITAGSAKELIKGDSSQWFIVVPGFACALAFSLTAFYFKRDLTAPRMLEETDVRPRRCLIVTLSPPTGRNAVINKDEDGKFSIQIGDKKIPSSGDIIEDIAMLENSQWPWQQFMRGIAAHKGKLEMAYLIGTDDVGGREGSFKYKEAAGYLLWRYMGLDPAKIVYHPKPVHPDRFNPITQAINEGIKACLKMNYKESDIVIDVTGATKMVSIAAASVTLNKNAIFQYVQTNPEIGRDGKPIYKVKAYDIIALAESAVETH